MRLLAAAAIALALASLSPPRAKLPRDAQDQCRRRGRAAERGAHRALCGEGARLFRQALRRCQHHPVRRRRGRHLGHGGGAGHRDLEPARRRDRARAEGQADLGPRAAPAAGLRRARRGEDRRGPQGQAALGGRRRRRLQLADGTRGAALGRAYADDAQFISQGTAGRLPGFIAGQIEGVLLHPEDVLPGAAEEARRACAGHAVRPAAALRVQSLRRVRRVHREGPRAAASTPSRR